MRLLQVAHNIANGFFQANHFLVLPDPNPHVFLPDLPYLSIPRFWDRVARIQIQTTPINKIIAPVDLVHQTSQLIAQLPQPNITTTLASWDKSKNAVISEIYRLIPSKRDWIKNIVIWPSTFGTTCSFNILKEPGDVYIWLRQDQGVSTIVEAILTSLTRQDIFDHLDGTWSESEILVDWLLTYSPLAKLLPPTPKTIKSTRTLQNAGLVQTSQEFLRKIGAPSVPLSHIDTSKFSTSEKQLFDLLTSRSPQIVPFAEISTSLYSAAKSIQRLRDQLESQGLSGSFIQTKRGEGYLLTN